MEFKLKNNYSFIATLIIVFALTQIIAFSLKYEIAALMDYELDNTLNGFLFMIGFYIALPKGYKFETLILAVVSSATLGLNLKYDELEEGSGLNLLFYFLNEYAIGFVLALPVCLFLHLREEKSEEEKRIREFESIRRENS